MGCDIHMFSERKPSRPAMDEDREVWINCDLFTMNEHYTPETEDEWEHPFEVQEVYRIRNYHLFSVLADVRNYENNEYIDKPRGLPNNCCEYIQNRYKLEEGDAHSASWFTLAEIKAFRKRQFDEGIKAKYFGYMSPNDAVLVDKGEMPNYWWKGGNTPNQVYREWEIQEDILEPLVAAMEVRKLNIFKYDRRPVEEIDAEYRIVFWFDN